MPGQFGAPPSGYQVYGQGAGLTLAEPGKRILARLIDAAIMIVVFVIPAFIIMFAMAGSASNNSSGFNFGLSAATVVFGLILLLLPTAYEVGMTATRGATVGKMIMKIKVTRADGMPMDIATALRRFSPSIAASVVGVFCCLGSIASLGILIANVIMIFQPTRLSLYDKVGQTVVVPTDV